jgi:hypothetical protein
MGTFIAAICDYLEKSALGFSIGGFGTFVFLMYFTRMLLDEKLPLASLYSHFLIYSL